ncbi:MAG: steroid 5-alpha reductase family enzyme [Candidatus Pelagisphaera sp.]|jgi:steroid 5-alpha reductase family enzyme
MNKEDRKSLFFMPFVLLIAIGFIALPVLSGSQYFSPSSPLPIYCLLGDKSGIPILEKSADKRRAHLKPYQEYKRATPPLFPSLRWLDS